jgi:hypothetical protein
MAIDGVTSPKLGKRTRDEAEGANSEGAGKTFTSQTGWEAFWARS